MPPAERAGRRAVLVRVRLAGFLRRRRTQIVAIVLFYAGLCLVPMALGQPQITVLALLPLLMVPPVAYLAYLIAWHEFHR